MRMYPAFVQLKALEGSVCVAAEESVHCFSTFVCFDLVLWVQVNIILKTWQAVVEECSQLLICLLLMIFWATYEFPMFCEHVR